MASVRQLLVSLKLQADDYSNKIRAAQREGKEFEKTIRPIKGLLHDLGSTMTVVGGAVVTGMLAATKATADFGDEMNDAAKRTGITTENLSRLKLAADTSGTSFEGLTTGLKFLGKNMELANAGGKEQIAAFKAAGISTKDLAAAHGDVNQILLKLSNTFANSADGAGKTAISMQLLGKSGADLIPFLNEGPDGLKRFGDEAERMGRVVSKEAAAAADEFNDKLAILEGSVKGLGGSIGTALIPPLTELIKKTTDVVVQMRRWTDVHPDLTRAIAGTSAAIGGAGGFLVVLTAVLAILPKIKEAIELLRGSALLLAGPFVAVAAAALYFRKELGEGLLMVLEKILGPLAGLFQVLSRVADAIGNKGLGFQLQNAASSLLDFREKITDNLNALAEQELVIGKTAKQLSVEEQARAAAVKQIEKHNQQLHLQGEAADEALKKQQQLIDHFTASLKPADDLNKELAVLHQRFSDQQIVAVYAEKIVEAAEAQKAHGAAVSGDVARLYEWAKAAVAVKESAEAAAAARKKLQEELSKPLHFEVSTQVTIDRIKGLNLPLPEMPDIAVPVPPEHTDMFNRLAEAEKEAQRRAQELSQTLREMKAAGMDSATIMAQLGDEINRTAEDAKKFKSVKLDTNVQQVISWETWRKDGQKAIDQIVGDMSKLLIEGRAHGQKFWESFTSIGKNAITSLADTFLSKMLHSFLDPFAQAFGKMIDKLASQITSSIGGALGGVLNRTGNGGFGNGTTPPTFPTGTNNQSNAGVFGRALAAGAGLTALGVISNRPSYNGGLNPAVPGINPYDIGAAQRYWVKNFQDPFTKQLKETVDSFNKAFTSGDLVKAQAAIDDLTALITQFQQDATTFSKVGIGPANTIKESMKTIEDAFGPGLQKIFDPLINLVASSPLNPIYDSFRKALKPADDLNEELERLSHAFSKSDLVKVYADQIISATEAQREHGYAVTGLISELESVARLEKTFANGVPRVANSANRVLGEFIGKLSKLGSGASDTLGTVVDDASKLIAVLTTPRPAPKSDIAMFGDFVDIFGKASARFGEAVDKFLGLPQSGQQVAAAGAMEVHFDHIEINITAPVQVAQKIDRRTVRDEIMPEWFTYVEDAAGERLTKIVKNRMKGVVTTA